MKRLFVLFIFLFCGCSNRVFLNCSYIDGSSILGSKSVTDIISFKNNHIVSYERDIIFSVNSESKDVKSVYKIVKLEGKALKKYIGGKYKISRDSNGINMVFSSKRVNDLKYIGIENNYGYDQVISVYNEIGFSCKEQR